MTTAPKRKEFRRISLVARAGFGLSHVQISGPASTTAESRTPAPPPSQAQAPGPAAPQTPKAPARSGQPDSLPLTPFVRNQQGAVTETTAPKAKSCFTCPPRQRTGAVKVYADGPQSGELIQPVQRDFWCEKNSVADRPWLNATTMRCYNDRECCEAAGGACSTPTESSPMARVIERRSGL